MSIIVNVIPEMSESVSYCKPSVISIMRKLANGETCSPAETCFAKEYVKEYERKAEIRRSIREFEKEDRINEICYYLLNCVGSKEVNVGDSVTVLSVQSGLDNYIDNSGNTYNERRRENENAKRVYTRPLIQKALDKLVNDGYMTTSIKFIYGYSNKVKIYTFTENCAE